MLVTIVAVANEDNTGLDLDRLEKVEDLDPDIARQMLNGGTARQPSEQELADYRTAQQKTAAARKPQRRTQPAVEDTAPEGERTEAPADNPDAQTDAAPTAA